MAPSRGRSKAKAASSRNARPKTTRSTRSNANGVPDVYQEMLAEEERRSPRSDIPERPLKRRRVATSVRAPVGQAANASDGTPSVANPSSPPTEGQAKDKARAKAIQTIEASSDDSSEDEDEFAFEDVDLNQPSTAQAELAVDDAIADVSISLDPSSTSKPRAPVRRKPASSAEKALRLLIHKAHILCLLGHLVYVNTWCNDINVQQHLHPLLSKKALTYLQGKEEYSQFQRDRSFRDGLEQASEVFRAHFNVSASGMRRTLPTSTDGAVEADSDVPSTSRQDLIAAAREMEGSQDVGNQLFCALLRSAGVDARLVCSLQPVPLSSVHDKPSTTQKPAKAVVRAMPPYGEPITSDSNAEDSAVGTSSTIGKVPSARRRLGQPSLNAQSNVSSRTAASPAKKRVFRNLDYPIFWVEAFNTAHQKWAPVDPLVTQTIGKPSKFEPPSSYGLNQMSYVVAFEEDGVARDVTRRYTKAYNAKTRRTRVESTENGAQWFKKSLRFFRRRGGVLDRDQTEDAELNQKEAREGLPANVQDFKDHPVYALERHLKRHEIIEPKREIGKVNAGTAAKPRMEPVYRRSDVLVCRSADKWYRLGREIQQGQAPIKHVPARNVRRGRSLTPDGEADEPAGAGMTALYAHHQTEQYVAPPVVNGRVPRNAFGNLDMYVPSMVPPGGTHIRHALAQQAARNLRVDYADAVTGFQFKGRHGTAIVQGAVVASVHAEAVQAVIDGLLDERVEEESLARSAAALRTWKRFLTGLRIKARIEAHAGVGEGEDVREAIDRQVEEQEEIAEAGGFFAEEAAMPTAGRFSLVEMARAGKGKAQAKAASVGKGRKRKDETESEEEVRFSGADSEAVGEEVPSRRSKRARRKVVPDEDGDEDGGEVEPSAMPTPHRDVDTGGGGFLPDASEHGDDGGGFLPEDGVDVLDEGGGGGGGFIPEDDDDFTAGVDGGEFVAETELHDVPGSEAAKDEGVFSGGGFLPDEDAHQDDQGGFVPDDAAPATSPSQRHDELDPAPPTSTATLANPRDELAAPTDSGEESHVFPTDDAAVHSATSDDGETRGMHGALPSSSAGQQEHTIPPSDTQVHEPTPVTTAVDSKGVTDDPLAERETSDDRDGEEEEEEEDEEEEEGSLLSHDPEDEDAEPDWLESD